MGEIVPNVHRIDGIVGPNAYLIDDPDALTVVDTSLPLNTWAIHRYMRRLGRRPRDLRYILLTHGHPDHTGSAWALRRRTGAHLHAHRDDVRLDRRGHPRVTYMGIFGRLPLPLPFVGQIVADGFLQEGQTLPILEGLRVLHTPGHTPGSVCLYLEERGILFTGDLVVADRKRVGRSLPFPGSDWSLYQRSLKRVARLDFQVACLGHGGPILSHAAEVVRALAEQQKEPPLYWRLFRRTRRALVRS